MTKSRYLAMALNFLVPGLGYVYLGKKKIFGALMVLGSGLVWLAFNLSWRFELGIPIDYQLVNAFGELTIGMAFAYDAYRISDESTSVD